MFTWRDRVQLAMQAIALGREGFVQLDDVDLVRS